MRISETVLELGKVRKQEVPGEIRDAAERDDIRHVQIIGEIENHNPLSGYAFVMLSPNPASFD